MNQLCIPITWLIHHKQIQGFEISALIYAKVSPWMSECLLEIKIFLTLLNYGDSKSSETATPQR